MVRQLREQGYRIKGIYIGTEFPDINIERIAQRVRSLTGYDIDPERVRGRNCQMLWIGLDVIRRPPSDPPSG